MVLTWLISLRARDASLADISWGLCFVAIAWTCCTVGPEAGDRSLLIAILVSLWGFRLAGYVAWRHEDEDRRYQAMRKKHGSSFALRSLVSVFVVQAVIAWIVSVPIQVAATDGTPSSIGVLGVIGALVCIVGLACEATADFQLSRFLADPDSKGKVMDQGIWGWSRHPNYFGELGFWFSMALFGVAAAPADWWWLFIGVAAMLAMFLGASIPLMEKRSLERRPNYQAVIDRVPRLVPRPPRRAAV